MNPPYGTTSSLHVRKPSEVHQSLYKVGGCRSVHACAFGVSCYKSTGNTLLIRPTFPLGGGGGKVGTKWRKYMSTCALIFCMKTYEHARLLVISYVSSTYTPHYHNR